MFEAKYESSPKPRYLRIGPYIVSMEFIHGVMKVQSQDKEFPYQIYVTYTDKSTVALQMPNKEECEKACDKIAEELGAK